MIIGYGAKIGKKAKLITSLETAVSAGCSINLNTKGVASCNIKSNRAFPCLVEVATPRWMKTYLAYELPEAKRMTTASMTPSSVPQPFGVIERVNLASRSNAFGKTAATTGFGGLSKEQWKKRNQRRKAAEKRDADLLLFLAFRNRILEHYWAAQSLGGLGALFLEKK